MFWPYGHLTVVAAGLWRRFKCFIPFLLQFYSSGSTNVTQTEFIYLFPGFIHMTCKCLFDISMCRFKAEHLPSRIASAEALTNASAAAWSASEMSRDGA